jgi:endoglucanase
MRTANWSLLVCCGALATSCVYSGFDKVEADATTGGQSSNIGGNATGGLLTAGGTRASGGDSAVGGSLGTGGSIAVGGTNTIGGATSAGGTSTIGGDTLNSGGNTSSPAGGASNTGGFSSTSTGELRNSGGASSTGGRATTGGTVAAGGASSSSGNGGNGGVFATGGSHSTTSTTTGGATTGGVPSTGGMATLGGMTSTGGTGASQYCGYQPVPNSQNTSNFSAGSWYTSWKNSYYVDCGDGTARVATGQGSSATTVSEGIGYGMLMAAGNDDRSAFDKLWAYYRAHEDANGLMNWQIGGCGPGFTGQFSDSSADEDVAMALVQADAKWGGYATDAMSLIGLIKKYETSQTTTPTYLRPGDAPNNGGRGEGVVNPSYFAPGYWHVWATYTGDTSWNQLATDAYAMLAKFQGLSVPDPINNNYMGALVPDWGNSLGLNPDKSTYFYEACRTPWRVATDYVWFCTAEAQTFLQNVSNFIDAKGGLAAYATRIGPSGAGNSAFLGPFALSGMAVSQAKSDTYLNAWLSSNMDDTPYFQGSFRGLCLLLANHNFPKGN